MKCRINRHAAKVLKEMIANEGDTGRKLRVYVTHMHGDHSHYDLRFDTPTEHDEIVHTDKGIDILLDTREKYLHGIWIQYFYVPQEELIITNPVLDRLHHGHHH